MAERLFLEVTVGGKRSLIGLLHVTDITETSTGKAIIHQARADGVKALTL